MIAISVFICAFGIVVAGARLWSGSIRAPGGVIGSAEQPLLYWIIVAGIALMTMTCFLLTSLIQTPR